MPRPGRPKAYCKVYVNGQDVTAVFDPYLISVTVTDYEFAIDSCEIELDDSHGVLQLPQDNAPIRIELGWSDEGMVNAFTGKVTDVVSKYQRRAGRTVTIEGKGADLFGLGKQPVRQEWGEGDPPEGQAKKMSLSTVLGDAAKAAGYKVNVSEELGKLERDYWSQNGESFHAFGARLAREVGGVFKVSGGEASVTSGTHDTNAVGKSMPGVTAAWGVNLIAWNIRPKVGRPVFAATQQRWFNDKEGKWEAVKKAIGGSGDQALTKAIHTGLMPVATADQAQSTADADAGTSMRRKGYGWVIVNGEPAAAAGSTCTVKGARAGVDGTYRITEAEHTYYRRGGFTTRLSVDQPGGAAGQDKRGEFER